MLVSTKGRYALRLMVYIARAKTAEYVSLRVIAEKEGISLKYLEQLARSLLQAGLLKSSRGKTGGYGLALSAQSIPVGDILRAAEGSTNPVSCAALDADVDCPREPHCNIANFWVGLSDVIDAYVDGVMLSDLAQ